MKHFLLLTMLGAGLTQGAWAQSLCASDGQATPLALVERFISADCEACWNAPPSAKSTARTLALDWIVPSARGDEAPLSAAASRDALLRLGTLGRAAPATSSTITNPVVGARVDKLRVAHGVPVGDYIGASITLETRASGRRHGPLSVWLALVETIPAGAEGTPTQRNLVRNVFMPTWNEPAGRSKAGPPVFREARSLSIPQGATPARLRVVGWVQDARGRVLTAAQSVCAPPA